MDSLEALKNIAYGLGNKKEDYEYELNVISNELKVLKELKCCFLNMETNDKDLLEYHIDEFFKEFSDELSARVNNNLKRYFDDINKNCRDYIKINYYDTMKKFLEINPNRLYNIRNLGKKSVKEILNMLESHGLYFNYDYENGEYFPCF